MSTRFNQPNNDSSAPKEPHPQEQEYIVVRGSADWEEMPPLRPTPQPIIFPQPVPPPLPPVRPAAHSLPPTGQPAVPGKKKELPPATCIGTNRQTNEPVLLEQSRRVQGVYILGTNGTGKSTLIEHLIVSDLEQGLGLCLLDPHGDLTKQVIAACPKHRVKDLIHLDIANSASPFGLNLFACSDPTDVDTITHIAEFVYHVFAKVWNVGPDTPQLAQVLRHVTYTLISNPGTTFAEIPLLLTDADVREKLVSNVPLARTRQFWMQYNKLSARDQREATNSTLNKVDAFLTNPLIANIVGQAETTIDFQDIMDNGRVLLVQLSPRLEEISNLIGAVVIGKLLDSAYSRQTVAEDKRRQFHIYADEFQRFATPDFATLINESRKFRVGMLMAHQTASQIEEELVQTALSSGTKIIFRVTGEDAELVAKVFDHTPPPVEVIGQRPILSPKRDVIDHLIKNGHSNPKHLDGTKILVLFRQVMGEHMDSPTYARPMTGGGVEDMIGNLIIGSKNKAAYKQHQKDVELLAEFKAVVNNRLNNLFYEVMRDRDADKPFDTGDMTVILKMLEAYPFVQSFPNMLVDLCDPNPAVHLPALDTLDAGAQNIGRSLATSFLMGGKLNNKEHARRVRSTITGFRQLMHILALDPILVDSGQFEPIYDKPRTYADCENQIASDLANQPNRQAKVKIIEAEYEIATLPPVPGLVGSELDSRLALIREATVTTYCRERRFVEEEMIERQEQLIVSSPKVSRGAALETEDGAPEQSRVARRAKAVNEGEQG
jgi:hypothetical protein